MAPSDTPPASHPRDSATTAREHYRREKARRARHGQPDRELLAAAKREYLALLEADAVKGKGGRPRKQTAARPADTEDPDRSSDTED